MKRLILGVFVLVLGACSEQNVKQDTVTSGDVGMTEESPTGEDWLAVNAKREGVIVTDSGLQYEVLESGDGKTPAATDIVVAHYEGRFTNGKMFDSSYKRGAPLEVPVNKLINGWTEALQLMQEGDKWKLYVHPDLGYGERTVGQIPPNSVLVFELTLLEVKSA